MNITIKKSILSGITFFITIILCTGVYGYVLNLGGKSAGNTLVSLDWNSLVDNVDTIRASIVPTGAIIAFNSTTCPTGWIAANGTNGTLDLRGEFLRGWDNGRGVDAGRSVGTSQTGTAIAPAYNTLFNGNRNAYIPDEFPISDSDGSYAYSSTSGRSQINNVNYYSDWTVNKYKVRPRNVAILFCIKQ